MVSKSIVNRCTTRGDFSCNCKACNDEDDLQATLVKLAKMDRLLGSLAEQKKSKISPQCGQENASNIRESTNTIVSFPKNLLRHVSNGYFAERNPFSCAKVPRGCIAVL